MDAREELRIQILEPLASDGLFDQAQLKQIHGEIAKAKSAVVHLQIEIIR